MVKFLDENTELEDLKLVKIKEGFTDIFVPDPHYYKQKDTEYLPTSLPVFYNPVMEINRDLTIALTKMYMDQTIDDKIYFVEAMAGTGIRGFRLLNEIRDDRLYIIMNDASPTAFKLMKYNAEVFGYDSERLLLFNMDANYLFRKLHSDLHIKPSIIDIDPYGTPAPFVFNALSCLKKKMSMLLVTATDTAPLVGKFPNAALRKYGSRVVKNPFSKEIAVRVLTYMIGREGTILSIKTIPILGLFLHHFIRLVLITERGRRKADEFWQSVGWISFCPVCNSYDVTRGITSFPSSQCFIKGHGNTEIIGPIWVDPIFDPDYIGSLINVIERQNSINKKNREKMLEILHNEREVSDLIFYYDIQDIARRLRVSTPQINVVVEFLKKKGFRASRTHFNPTAIKTDASIHFLIEAVKEIAP